MGEASPYPHECVASPGNGSFAKFPNITEGIWANIDLLTRKYAGKTPEDITRIWAGNPQSKGYWEAIDKCFQ